jgi:diguanylate cyclase (GGDEF)-like protein
MQLLGANTGGEPRPGNRLPGLTAELATPAGPTADTRRWGRLRTGRRGARVRARLRQRRHSARLRRSDRDRRDQAGLPSPLLTPPLAIPNPLRDRPSGASEDGFDKLAFGTPGGTVERQGGIPWPRSPKPSIKNVGQPTEGTEPPESADDEDDTAEWDQPVPLAIDLSDGPKLIRRPPAPLPPDYLPTPRTTGTQRAATDSAALPVAPQAVIEAPAPITVDLSSLRAATSTEFRRVPEALLTVILAVIASATAWAIAATPQVWLALSAVPAAGLLALLLPGRALARVLRATALIAAAAVLPVLDPAMTPVCLVVVLATVASYPLMVGPKAGCLVTGLAAAAPAGALTGRILRDGPDRTFRLLLHPEQNPSIGIQIALASGVLVAVLIGVTSTTARRRLIGAAAAARAGERQARAEAAALAAASCLDPATGLPNRDGLLRAVALILTEPEPIAPVGLVLADLDRFDDLADNLGAGTADELAAQTGRRIAETFSDYLVARVARHQFAVVLSEDMLPPNPDTCADVARAITRLMLEPVVVPEATGGREFTLSCSLGGVVSGPGLITADDLLQAADEAVRTAQRGGRGRWTMFDQAVRAHGRKQAELETELRQAVGRGLIDLDFQPMLALGHTPEDDDRISGAEARPRWRRRDGDSVAPETFVPLADDLGLGVTLGLQMINRALAALVIWRHEGVGVDQVWVSLPPAPLNDPDFAHEVAAQLAIRGLSASCLVLQVNAGELEESGPALMTLGMLRSLGISVALNDFGCGGTSLTMLRRLPISAVKLDGRLAAELGGDDHVPRAAAQLCHSLGLRVICASVQTSGQLEGARQIGADAVQGQAIARPMSAQDVTNLLTLRMPRALRLRTEP